ncbi:MAG: substrate-binding domain-containing protein [Anaerolineae bacterium]|nr:substrate-binding domain-containing protein [Anaerolineae bacterium]
MLKTAKRTIVIFGLAALASSCRGMAQQATHTPEISHLRVIATTSTAPLAQDLIQAYVREDALFVISLSEANWSAVQKQLTDDPAFFGITTFLPEASTLWATPIGEDGLAIIVHPDLQLDVLTAAQLRTIFSGGVRNWREVGGPNLPIVVVSREAGADTRAVFERLVMGERPVSGAAVLAPTSSSILDIVATTEGAISYTSFGSLNNRVRVVPVAASANDTPVPPTLQTIANKTYPLRMPILIVSQKQPDSNSTIYEFFLWIQQGGGQEIIRQRYAPLIP